MTRMFDHVVDPDVQFNIRQFVFNKPLETILISSFIFNLLNWFSYRSLFISYLVLILYCKVDVIKGIIFEYIFRNVTEFMIHERNKMVMAPFMKERDIDDDENEESDFNRDEQKHHEVSEERENEERENEERENEERENGVPKDFSKDKAYHEFMDLLNNEENKCGECNCEDEQSSEHEENHESEEETEYEEDVEVEEDVEGAVEEPIDVQEDMDKLVQETNVDDSPYLELRKRIVHRT